VVVLCTRLREYEGARIALLQLHCAVQYALDCRSDRRRALKTCTDAEELNAEARGTGLQAHGGSWTATL